MPGKNAFLKNKYLVNFDAKFEQNCRDRGSNAGPLDLQSNALPTELSRRIQDVLGQWLLRQGDKFSGVIKRRQVPPRFELGSQDSES